MTIINCKDGKSFDSKEFKCVGSTKKARSCDLTKPAAIGEFPVFVEQSGNYRMFTYSSKIVSIEGAMKQEQGALI